MPGLPTYKGKFKFDNYISMQMLITNNKEFQTMIVKSVPSNDNTTYALDNSESFSPITSTKRLRSCKSKRINKNKNDNKFFNPITLTKRLHDYENKHFSKDIN